MSTNIVFPAAQQEALYETLLDLDRKHEGAFFCEGMNLKQMLYRLGLEVYVPREDAGDLVVDRVASHADEFLINFGILKVLTPFLAAENHIERPCVVFIDEVTEAPFERWVLMDGRWVAQVPQISWVVDDERTLG